MVLILALVSWTQKQCRLAAMISVTLLLIVVGLQAALGFLSVEIRVMPVMVTGHILLGFITFWLLFWIYLRLHPELELEQQSLSRGPKKLARFGILVLFLQIILGGWTSTNYAALACGVDFPTCLQQWLPDMDFVNGFDLSHSPGVNYEFGVLDSPARTAIQFVHRVGALTVFVYLFSFALMLLKKGLGRLGAILLFVLALQVGLGIMNVVLALPLSVAVFHNLGAALLLLTVIAINHRVFKS
jgi:heme A synthase